MWTRTSKFTTKSNQQEIWQYKGKDYLVDVTFGKPVDILKLKANMVEDYQHKVDIISKSRKEIYGTELQEVKCCPICGHEKQREALQIYGAQYVQCENCTHYFVKRIPTKETLDEFYKNDKEYQSTYADPKTTQTRIDHVAKPKAEWVISQYERLYGRKPRSIMDVGAGSGHFVRACRYMGMLAAGIEPSETGRQFAKDNLDVLLLEGDFLEDYGLYRGYDVVTFWGVLEHVTNPMEFLKSAKSVIKKKGLVVAEVPRWDCMSTTIQTIFPNSVVRHLDPLGHIQCFTDSSLATAFVENGYSPVAAWLFGMDAYEMFIQLFRSWSWQSGLKRDDILYNFGELIPQIQQRLDLAKLSDEIVIAAKV